MQSNFSITIVTGTLNPHLCTFTRMLKAVKNQKYKGKIKHLILDGGTKNGGIELAKKFGCIVKVFQNDSDEGSNRLYPSLQYMTGDILVILESDNIPPTRYWISEMIQPFEDKEIFATFPAYNTATPDMNMLTRYTALLGSPDPTLYYLGKSDKIPVFQGTYDKGEILRETKEYYKIRFTKETLPTVGDNGFAIRADIFKGLVKKNDVFYHTDKFVGLVTKTFDTYGVTKNSIIHTTKLGILDQVKRRVQVKEHFTNEMKGKRVYLVYDPRSQKDRRNLLLYILYSLTIIQPLFLSIRGYIMVPDPAWFLHPVMCLLMVLAYGWSEIKWNIKTIQSSLCQKN